MAEKRQTAITTRIVWFLVVLFLSVTIISQLVIRYNNPFSTEPAQLYSFEDYVQSVGIFVRDEKTVSYSGGGIISYVYSDGEKLAKNSVVAKIYSSESDLACQLKIDDLRRQIDVLKDAEKLVGSDNSQLKTFSHQIYECHAAIIQDIIDGDYASAVSMKNDYLNLQSKKQIVSGEANDYAAKISELEERILSLRSQISSSPFDLTLQDTGYFISSADGYENTLNYESIDDLNKEAIEKIIKNPIISTDSSIIGKLVSDYKQKMVCIVPSGRTMGIYKGTVLKVRIGGGVSHINVEVESIKDADSENKILVLNFDVFNQNIILGRTARIKILFDEYEGIRIPSSAVHFDKEEQMGVFVKLGVNVYFKKIDVVRTEGDYMLVKDTTSKNGYLSLYDSVITEGSDLYDGKIII